MFGLLGFEDREGSEFESLDFDVGFLVQDCRVGGLVKLGLDCGFEENLSG